MFFAVLIFCIFAFDVPTTNPKNGSKCTGPRVVVDENGNCSCLDGYSHDNPITERGCWICARKCGENMFCDYPGECRCLPGLYLIGKQKCGIPIPEVKGFHPQIGDVNDEINVSISNPIGFVPTQAFCKFAYSVKPGIVLSPTLVKCKVPKLKTQKFDIHVQLCISYNSFNFSNEMAVFKITNDHQSVINLTTLIILIAICSSVFLLIHFWKVWKEKNKDEAKEPLLSQQQL